MLFGARDEVGVKVPRVHHDSVGTWIGHQHTDLVMIGLGLGERVVQHDVHRVVDGHGGVEFGDDDAIAVAVEHVGHPHDDDVVVVDERHGNGTVLWWGHGSKVPP